MAKQYHSPLYEKLKGDFLADEYEQTLSPYEKLQEYQQVYQQMHRQSLIAGIGSLVMGFAVWIIWGNLSLLGCWLLVEALWWYLMGGRTVLKGVLDSDDFSSWIFGQFCLIIGIIDWLYW